VFDPPIIAVVEDDEAMRQALSDLLQVLGLACRAFGRAESFLAVYRPGAFDCLITDMRLPGISGLELLQCLKQQGSAMPVIVLTSHADADIRSRAMASGAHVYLTKPLADDVLIQHLRSALDRDVCPRGGPEDTPDG
jgi:two-component system, LuxR family, response regulator FixJ